MPRFKGNRQQNFSSKTIGGASGVENTSCRVLLHTADVSFAEERNIGQVLSKQRSKKGGTLSTVALTSGLCALVLKEDTFVSEK